MTIDAHLHLGRLGDRLHTLESLQGYLDACRIERAIVSNLDAASHGANARDLDELDANLACLEAAQMEPRLLPLYWVRPGRVDSNLHAFAGALDTEPFVGAIFAARCNNFVADDERLDRHLAVLARLEKTAFFLVGREDAWRPQRVQTLARRFPRVPFVLCNTNPPAWNECVECVRQSREREDARLYLVTSHATVEDVTAAVREIGPERLLLGGDALGRAADDAQSVTKMLAALRADLPPDAYEALTHRNATTLLRLLN